ncbi:MAG: hypothetical protein BWX67_00397 [Thermotogae bacterium ADurb.Bin062]|jgi:hypothetical protein|nr:MAG: hypothetical protein BWX67_00397 [Thermotogota bacterium ADurb.Bin062]
MLEEPGIPPGEVLMNIALGPDSETYDPIKQDVTPPVSLNIRNVKWFKFDRWYNFCGMRAYRTRNERIIVGGSRPDCGMHVKTAYHQKR